MSVSRCSFVNGYRLWASTALFWLCGSLIVSCSSGGSSSTIEGEGIALPSEVSAVSAGEDVGESIRLGKNARGMAAALVSYHESIRGAVADLPADADYNTAQVKKFVEIKVLDIFEIIEQIFNAVGQTNYAEEDNVGAGWYKCMIAWEDEAEGGVQQTFLQEWYVNSTLVNVGGTVTNRVLLKIVEVDDEEESGLSLIRVQADVTQAPTENEDGTLADLGEWSIRASFGPVGEEPEDDEYFYATASILEDGGSQMTIQDQFVEDFDGPGGEDEVASGTRAIIFRSEDGGYGVAELPDWDACFMDPGSCTGGPPNVDIAFAYNENYLSVEVEGEDPQSFDRTDGHELVHRYQLFSGEDGSDVERDLTFGFPVRVQGESRFGWYGAWQDRHELWLEGDSIADGTTVVRDNVAPGEEAETYTTSTFSGVLTQIGLVEGSLDQVEGIAAEIWLFNDFRLRWNDTESRWDQCVGDDGFGDCETSSDYTNQLGSLEGVGEDDQKSIWIDHCGDDGFGGFECTNYVYISDTPGPGFFEATFNEESGMLESNGTQLDTGAIADGYELFCNISGRTYIQYTAEFAGPTSTTGWIERVVDEFDFETWTPTFNEEGDREFAFEVGREYFINNRGANLRVTRDTSDGDEDDYRVFMEAQEVAKPEADLSSIYPDGTTLVEPWDPDNNSKYELDTDSESENYLLLEYSEVSEQDQADGVSVGDVVTRDIWGLRIDGDSSDIQDATMYNWEYKEEGEYHGGSTYLVDGDGDYVLLSDPVRFQPIALATTDDIVNSRPEEEWLSYSLMFDGWLHGLPDPWFELEKVNFEGDQIPTVLAKNVRIPDGTELTAEDGLTTYYVKAVDVGIFLGFITDFPDGEEPDTTQADDIDLDADLPVFEAPDMDSTIPEADLRYIEGLPVE